MRPEAPGCTLIGNQMETLDKTIEYDEPNCIRHKGRRAWTSRYGPPLLLVCGVIAVFWKLVLSSQYTFLDSPDMANQVLPWLQAEVYAIRHWSVLLWTPYEFGGQSMIGQ